MQTLQASKRKIKYIVVHCTAGWQNESIEDLIKGFRLQGWKNNGYHIVVDATGASHYITPVDKIANGVAGHNSESIHISYMGGIAKVKGKIVAVDNRTDAQKITLVSVLKQLKKLHPTAIILGHRDLSPDLNKNGVIEPNEWVKQCPCFYAIPEYKNIK
jgi:N-acetylmuramoyl-L-alanine amidase